MVAGQLLLPTGKFAGECVLNPPCLTSALREISFLGLLASSNQLPCFLCRRCRCCRRFCLCGRPPFLPRCSSTPVQHRLAHRTSRPNDDICAMPKDCRWSGLHGSANAREEMQHASNERILDERSGASLRAKKSNVFKSACVVPIMILLSMYDAEKSTRLASTAHSSSKQPSFWRQRDAPSLSTTHPDWKTSPRVTS